VRLVATRGSIDRINKEKGLQTMGSGRKIMFNPDRSLDRYAPFRPVNARANYFSAHSLMCCLVVFLICFPCARHWSLRRAWSQICSKKSL